MCKLEQLLHILHKSSKRSESKTKINALTHFAYLNTHYKFCVKHYSQCTIFGVEIIKHFALFFQEIYAGDKKKLRDRRSRWSRQISTSGFTF